MVKWIIANFGEFEFYTPESYDTDNIIILSYYDGEDLTPTFLYFMDGLKGVLVWSFFFQKKRLNINKINYLNRIYYILIYI